MSWEAITAIGTAISALVVAASAIAAVVQISQMRATNQLEGFLALDSELSTPELSDARTFVGTKLLSRLEDPDYARELVAPYYDIARHPELRLAIFWEKTGALVRHGVLPTPLFLDNFARWCLLDWLHFTPAAKIMRQTEKALWDEFEYLALLSQAYQNRRHSGSGPTIRVRD